MSSSLSELDSTMMSSPAAHESKSQSSSSDADGESSGSSGSSSDTDSDADMSTSDETSPVPKSKDKKVTQASAAPAPPKKAPVKKPTAITPAKRKAAAMAKTEKQEDEDADMDERESPEGNDKSKSVFKRTSLVPIPTSWETASEADKELMRMKEAGETWPNIKKRWESLAGQRVGTGTLPHRYVRLKAHMAQFSPDDIAKLKLSKQEIEACFEKQKWSMIADSMGQKGSKGFSAVALAKKWRELE